ncbi:golgi-body localization protein domain-containing protein [Mycena alexandri]|uniref:Golgi-body localization protein domain-containing protein n=1 Tax=Mycena alexandri TaxID=1745969 RepID=A0AAD6TNV2_9AGAR|nr:golgi-body localization protein domain-containing protein [Mycena alexandri]
MTLNSLFDGVLYILRVLLLARPTDLWWTTFSVWLVWLVTFSFVLRTYIVPWAVGRMSRHLRVRSISFRSIRGLYVRAGTQTFRADRIIWTWSYVERSRRMTFQVHGLTLEVGSPPQPTPERKGGALTFADLAPSPMAHRLWMLFSGLYTLIDPFLRPLVRAYFAACLRLLIRWVPGISQALALDIHSPIITFADRPGAKIVTNTISIRTVLAFTQTEKPVEVPGKPAKAPSRARSSYSVGAWRRRLTNSVQRSWDRAWGQTHGSAKVELKLHDIRGSMDPLTTAFATPAKIFALPGSIDFDASLGFSPKSGSIDPHSVKVSLTMSDAEVDIRNMIDLLEALERRKPKQQDRHDPELEPLLVPPTPYFRDSIVSPLLSPVTPSMNFFSPASPVSPRSPFFGAFSTQMPRRHIPLCVKLKEIKDTSTLAFLASVTFRLSKITVTVASSNNDDQYKVVIRDTVAKAEMSHPDRNPLHRRWLGSGKNMGQLDPDGYVLNFATGEIKMDRIGPLSRIHLLVIQSTDFQSLAIQWPGNWLHSSPFIGGDPNAPLLAVHVTLGAIDMTERLDYMTRLFVDLPQAEHNPPAPLQSAPSHGDAIPRVSFEVDCGPICARLIVGNRPVDPSALELRTDGFIVSIMSRFSSRPPSRFTTAMALPLSDFLPLHLHVQVAVVLRPLFVRVCSKDPEAIHAEDPVLLSMEALELTGHGKFDASICEDANVALVDVPSKVLQLHCTTDALCIELWHPLVIDTLMQVVSSLPASVQKPPSQTSSSMVEKMPRGVSATMSLARCVIFVTAPDINPDDTMDLCRGFAIRATGLSIQYCSLRANPDRHSEWRSSTRQKLYLSQETLLPALLAASRTNSGAVFVAIALPDLAFRSAVSTQYDADDPLIAERDDPNLKAQEFLHIKNSQALVSLSGGTFWPTVSTADSCEVSLVMPYIHGSLQLAHMYSILLGIATVKQLAEARPTRLQRTSRTFTPRARPIIFKCNVTIRTVQVFCALLKQNAVLRLDAITLLAVSNKPTVAKWDRAVAWVKVPQTPKLCEFASSEERWEEFLCLQKWTGTFHPGSIEIEADNARIRIPYGFVLAELVLDISVIVKAVRHLAKICIMGRYYAMPTPEPEGPKSVPKILLNIRSLSAEAADDPFESSLGIIFRTGLDAAKNRKDREAAFEAKVQSILTAETFSSTHNAESPDYNFDANHSISIEEARERLDEVHSVDWAMRLNANKHRQAKEEDAINRKHVGVQAMKVADSIPNLVKVTPTSSVPPLIRLLLTNISLNLAPPSFPISDLPHFLYKQGNGLPLGTEFSLLVPMHLNFGLSSLRVTLRDYPLPLVNIPAQNDKTLFVFDFDSDLVIAEEMGTALSVDWVDCLVVSSDYGLPGAAPFSLAVPKTIMPVKSYANPVIDVTATAPTIFSWGVSYGPATQDLMRIVETLSSAPRDSSPGMGFWDKMRLIFHWTIKADFAGEVRFQMKGLRDPYNVNGAGAGFLLAWQGSPRLLIAQENQDKELIQVTSDSMVIAIPDFSHLMPKSKRRPRTQSETGQPRPFRKICAKFRSGVCFGIGFVMERSCGPECSACSGSPFHRKCRFYDFLPHYDIKLQKKPRVPARKSAEDSFNGFRSDFIHLSMSLTSALNAKPGMQVKPSSLHLTPQAFTHFWSWWTLFDGVLSLPTRQGSAWPIRPISPKFGRHLATLKYRISVKSLYLLHAYIDNSRETWADGVTPWIGVKGIIEEFQVDMHQREEESIVPGHRPNTTKLIRRKPFYAIELVLKGLDLRAMLATFDDSLKEDVGVSASPQRSNYRNRTDLPPTPDDSAWIDEDDFVELDWTPPSAPSLHFLPVATCPRFTYFRRAAPSQQQDDSSKFGLETTHTCYLGKQPSVLRVQIDLAMVRIAELEEEIREKKSKIATPDADLLTMKKMLALLQDYITLLQKTEAGSKTTGSHSYHIPADTLSEAEWAEFDNVYQIHCPKIFMDSAIRDIMMQYYYCSRARRGLEYHMATRAVKFIRDQAEDVSVMAPDKHRSLGTAQAAAHALRKILGGHERKSVDNDPLHEAPIDLDPLDGWFDGVSLQKGHCCLLLKPQIVLRDEAQTCVVAAVQAKLQSYAIMDDSNVDDPVSGKVMSRTFTTLSGLQTFSPSSPDYCGDGCVPLEVLIDFRCESNDFERLVPQTDATFHYDKFNRLRLRNNVTSVVRSVSEKPGLGNHNHLHDQTDLIQVNIPQFTVTANDQHFQIISNIVAKLLLFSDAAHKTRMNKLETLLFTYDFNDLPSVANVVTDLQLSLRDAIETELMADISHLTPEAAKLEMLKLKAHKMLLAEELGGLFECIKLAQDQRENQSEPKSALLLHTYSSEISWRMLDDQQEMLAKLVVQNIDFFWLSRQDSSTVNNLTVGNLQAFDGSRDARWAEILSKYDEPATHPLLKRGLFVLANWSILAPVGGITIYESFELNFHPMRLQVDAKVGRRIMEYVWPARRNRKLQIEDESLPPTADNAPEVVLARASLDSPRTQTAKKATLSAPMLSPPIKLSASRSFTDLRSASLTPPAPPRLHRTASSGALRQAPLSAAPSVKKNRSESSNKVAQLSKKAGDAAEMKTRSSQKSFVFVRVSSLNLLLSIMKEESFVCRDAHIRTRDLEYRNQTWSFEELVDQFIPSDMSWKGWLKMAFHQPLVPVLPVARELISKTKWIANKNGHDPLALPTPPKMSRTKATEDDGAESDRPHSPHPRWRRARKTVDSPAPVLPGAMFTTEPEETGPSRPPSRNRMFSKVFKRPPKMTPNSSASTVASDM